MSTALILIDIQNDYFPGGNMELEGSVEAACAAARLLAAFRKEDWPIYHIQHVSNRPGATFFIPETRGVEINECVLPLASEPVIIKHYPNSFRETDLRERLQAGRTEQLLIGGMMTHMCVDATTRAAFDLGFSCTLAQDACAARSLTFDGSTIPANHVHGTILAALGAVYAQVRSTEAILGSMRWHQ